MVAHLAAAFWMRQAADPWNAFACARANEDEIGTCLCHCSSSLQVSISYLSRNTFKITIFSPASEAFQHQILERQSECTLKFFLLLRARVHGVSPSSGLLLGTLLACSKMAGDESPILKISST
jgi:hypothetical protein